MQKDKYIDGEDAAGYVSDLTPNRRVEHLGRVQLLGQRDPHEHSTVRLAPASEIGELFVECREHDVAALAVGTCDPLKMRL